MRSESLPLRLKIFLLASAITSHACHQKEGFRQRDLKFYLDLFLDWVGTPNSEGPEVVHNTQILRFLNYLEVEGYLKKSLRQRQPRYKLTRVGLIEAIRNLTEQKQSYEYEEILFISYFLANYSNKIIDLIKDEGLEFPPMMQQEIMRLLNYKALVKRELKKIEKHLELLRNKIKSNQQSIELTEKLIREKYDLKTIAEQVEKKHPYNLNTQKPLSKLLSEIPEDVRLGELTTSAKNREKFLWQNQYQKYQNMCKQLKLLAE